MKKKLLWIVLMWIVWIWQTWWISTSPWYGSESECMEAKERNDGIYTAYERSECYEQWWEYYYSICSEWEDCWVIGSVEEWEEEQMVPYKDKLDQALEAIFSFKEEKTKEEYVEFLWWLIEQVDELLENEAYATNEITSSMLWYLKTNIEEEKARQVEDNTVSNLMCELWLESCEQEWEDNPSVWTWDVGNDDNEELVYKIKKDAIEEYYNEMKNYTPTEAEKEENKILKKATENIVEQYCEEEWFNVWDYHDKIEAEYNRLIEEENENWEDNEDQKICTMEYSPVCWVNWKTYSNSCKAWNVEIKHKWACKKEEQIETETFENPYFIINWLKYPIWPTDENAWAYCQSKWYKNFTNYKKNYYTRDHPLKTSERWSANYDWKIAKYNSSLWSIWANWSAMSEVICSMEENVTASKNLNSCLYSYTYQGFDSNDCSWNGRTVVWPRESTKKRTYALISQWSKDKWYYCNLIWDSSRKYVIVKDNWNCNPSEADINRANSVINQDEKTRKEADQRKAYQERAAKWCFPTTIDGYSVPQKTSWSVTITKEVDNDTWKVAYSQKFRCNLNGFKWEKSWREEKQVKCNDWYKKEQDACVALWQCYLWTYKLLSTRKILKDGQVISPNEKLLSYTNFADVLTKQKCLWECQEKFWSTNWVCWWIDRSDDNRYIHHILKR